jgi:hypothetical protein
VIKANDAHDLDVDDVRCSVIGIRCQPAANALISPVTVDPQQ